MINYEEMCGSNIIAGGKPEAVSFIPTAHFLH